MVVRVSGLGVRGLDGNGRQGLELHNSQARLSSSLRAAAFHFKGSGCLVTGLRIQKLQPLLGLVVHLSVVVMQCAESLFVSWS